MKPYLKSMTKSELFTMMVGGMATVAGGVLAAFVGFGISAGHLLAASLMSAPAAIVIARVMFPETEHSSTEGQLKVELETDDVNIFDAACRGASDGLGLALNVGAMLLAFIALVKLVNIGIGYAGDLVGLQLSLEKHGWVCLQACSLHARYFVERKCHRWTTHRFQNSAQRIYRLHRTFKADGTCASRESRNSRC